MTCCKVACEHGSLVEYGRKEEKKLKKESERGDSPTRSLLAGGYCGFHRGKPVPFANRAPSWIFEARAPGYERASANGGHEKRTPGFLAEVKL